MKRSLAAQLATAGILCALAFGCRHFAPQTAQTVRQWLLGPEENRVAEAFSALSGSMEHEEKLGEAVFAFYMEMTSERIS